MNGVRVAVWRARNSSNTSMMCSLSSPGIFFVKFATQSRVVVVASWHAGTVAFTSVGNQ